MRDDGAYERGDRYLGRHDKVTVAGAFGIVFLVVGVILVNLNASAGPSL